MGKKLKQSLKEAIEKNAKMSSEEKVTTGDNALKYSQAALNLAKALTEIDAIEKH